MMRFPSRSPVRPSRPAALAFGLAAALAAALGAGGCININTKGYPEVERTDVQRLAATADDTAWVLAKPPFTVVGRNRQVLDVPAGLTGVARGWERMFGVPPGPATVVLVRISEQGRAESPVALPDSLASRTTVWVPTMRWDDPSRMRRMGNAPAVAGTPVMVGGPGGSAALQVAQAWLDARLMREESAALVPAWLRAGIVEALGGSEAIPVGRRGRGPEMPRLALDTLLARRCPEGWSPVARWRPRPAAEADSLRAARQAAQRAPEGDRSRDPERAFRENLRSACGLGLRLQAGSFVRYLMDRGGDPMVDRVLRSYLLGGTLEQAVAGAPGLPQTTAELDRAWRAWELDRIEQMRRSVGE